MNTTAKQLRFAFTADVIQILILCLAMAVVFACMSQMSPYFASLGNIVNATRFISEIGLIALGMALVIITGGIDLSVGSMLALSGIIAGMLSASGVPAPAVVAITLACGLAFGAFNGFLVTATGLPPIIVTLATLAIYRGLAMGISGAAAFPITGGLGQLGQGTVLGLPLQFLLLLVAALAIGFLTRKTTYGRRLYAVGANPIATLYSGISINRVKLSVYAMSGFFSALAALVFVARVSSAKANAGQSYELDAITIVVLGGIPLAGGRGSIAAVMLALLTVGLIRNGMSLAFVPSEVQTIVIGALLLAAVAAGRIIDVLSKTKKLRRPAPVNEDK